MHCTHSSSFARAAAEPIIVASSPCYMSYQASQYTLNVTRGARMSSGEFAYSTPQSLLHLYSHRMKSCLAFGCCTKRCLRREVTASLHINGVQTLCRSTERVDTKFKVQYLSKTHLWKFCTLDWLSNTVQYTVRRYLG